MNDVLIKIIEASIDKQRAEGIISRKSDNIYEKKLKQVEGFDYVPRTIYFTYVGFDELHEKVRVEHYFWPGGEPLGGDPNWKEIPYPEKGDTTVDSDLKKAITDLAQNAADKGMSPKSYGENFKKIEWRRRSYLVFFFDDIKWRLHKFKKNTEGVVFYDDKFGTKYTPNRSFYDGLDFEKITIKKNGKDVDGQAIVLVNHMKRPDGTDVTTEQHKDPYEFGMFFEVQFVAGNNESVTFVIDPGGTNQGPPIDP